eukprot:scaffold34524_cov38-Tisochrysis_lutea.AAC.3
MRVTLSIFRCLPLPLPRPKTTVHGYAAARSLIFKTTRLRFAQPRTGEARAIAIASAVSRCALILGMSPVPMPPSGIYRPCDISSWPIYTAPATA